MTTTATERLYVMLSREELYILLRLLEVKSLPGFDLSWLKAGDSGMLPRDVQHSLEVATNGLVARGYLSISDTTSQTVSLTMSAPLIALVAACAFAEYSILLSVRTPQGLRDAYLHEFQNLCVIHSAPFAGIHQFDAIGERADMLRVIENILGLDQQPEVDVPNGEIDVQVLKDVCDKILAKEHEQGLQLLIEKGLKEETARQLSTTIQNMLALGALTIAGRGANQSPASATLGIAVAPTSCFTFSRETLQNPHVQVRPVSAQKVKEWIIDHIKQSTP